MPPSNPLIHARVPHALVAAMTLSDPHHHGPARDSHELLPSARDYRDGAVVDGLVVSPGTVLDPLTPGIPGVVTETPGTPGMATLVLAEPGTVAAVLAAVAAGPRAVVAVPGITDDVAGVPGIFDVTSFAPGIKLVAPCVPGTEAAAPAAPGTPLAVPPGAVGAIEGFVSSSRIFSPSFTTPCAKAIGEVIAKASSEIVHAIVGRIGGSHLKILQHRSWWECP